MKMSEVAKVYGISKRTLRYYEERGFIESVRQSDRDERVYEKEQLKKLEHILLLKKVGFSLKVIEHILSEQDQVVLRDYLEERLEEVKKELDSMEQQKRLIEDMIKINKTGERTIDFQDLIKVKTYLEKYLEQVKGVECQMEDIILLEFGEGLIEEVMANDVPKQIGLIKEEITKKTQKGIPLVRIRDNVSLGSSSYHIKIKGVVIVHKEVEISKKGIQEMLQVLEKGIINNISMLEKQ